MRDVRPEMPNVENQNQMPVDNLSAIGFTLAIISCLAPIVYATLAMSNIMPVPWDAAWPVAICFFGGGFSAISALVVSLIARAKYRSTVAWSGILISVLAIPVVLFCSWLVAMIGLAHHPV